MTDRPAGRLTKLLEDLAEATLELDELQPELDFADQAHVLHALTRLATLGRLSRDGWARRMAPVVLEQPRHARQVPGVGTVEFVRGSSGYRYDTGLLLGAAIKAVAVDRETGEVRDVEAQLRELAAMLGCTPTGNYTGWRATVAARNGLQLDRYREPTSTDPKAVIK